MTINTLFNIGDNVYLKTDPDQHERMITEITIQPNNCIVYTVNVSDMTSVHYEIELTNNQDIKRKYNV